MRNLHSEQVRIIHMEPDDIQGSTGVVKVMVKNKVLTCFAMDYCRTFEPRIGESEIRVQLILDTFTESTSSQKDIQKTIIFSENIYTPYHCNLSGQIVDIIYNEMNTPNSIAIVDCGILVNVFINPDLGFHIGDSIIADGRLDIELA